MLAVSADAVDVVALRRVVQVGEAGVVELEVSAAQFAERRDLIGVDAFEVRPEGLDVRVHGCVDGGTAAAIVHHARRGYGQLRRPARRRLEEAEVVAEDAAIELELAGDAQRRRREVDVPVLVVELDLHVVLGLGDAANLVDEVHVPGGAPVLTVGNALEAE